MLNRFFKKFLYGITFFFALLFIILFLSIFRELDLKKVFQNFFLSELLFAVKLSFFTATTSALLSIIAGIPVAYFLARFDFRGKDILNTIFDLTNVLSPIAIGAMVLIFFNTGPGRFIEENIASFVFEVRGIILAQFFIVFGYSIRFLKNNFESLDRDYENIARTLGAGPFDVFIRV
ncbi:MAG: ABC transporter permease subunit, partial [Actinomycetia bacterium]|nr:ABC transporter permease subunit [Actinomycetes bacterium]